uniref:Sulfotransfer_1 domain-containing protein n=1 Tax=Macrostomum lignano TaxID=282301 RepID=A0A1I8F861_9PLAT
MKHLLTILLIFTSATGIAASGGLRRRLPQALIIGAKKSGTRALLAFSALHPAVRAAGPEAHFFDRHFRRAAQASRFRGNGAGIGEASGEWRWYSEASGEWRWYRRRMPRSRPAQLTLEKTPAYLVDPKVPSPQMNPEMKLGAAGARPRDTSHALWIHKKVPTVTLNFRRQLTTPPGVSTDHRRRRSSNSPFPTSRRQPDGEHSLVTGAHWPVCRAPVPVAGRVSAQSNSRAAVSERLVRDPRAAVMTQLQKFLGLPQLVTSIISTGQEKGLPLLAKVATSW